MTDDFTPTMLDVDRDGAIEETYERAAGSTRGGFLKRGALIGGGLIGGGAAFATPALAQTAGLGQGDIDILNFALTLEYLESAFYADAIAKGGLTGDVLSYAQKLGGHESTHVQTLQQVLGTNAIPQPTFDFKGTTSDQKTFLATAQTLEDTGVRAYKGQAASIASPTVLKSALSIHTVEAKHAAVIRRLNNAAPSPSSSSRGFGKAGATELPLTRSQVLSQVQSTGFITSGGVAS